MSSFFLSIIVPVYNVEKYLSNFLDSLIPAYNGDFEVFIVDDGSTDSSAEIAAEYAAAFPFIRMERQANAGLGAARNRGMELTEGKYVAFLDSDDWVLSAPLRTMIDTVKAHDAEMWISDFCRVADNGHILDRVYQIKDTTEPILDRAYLDEFLSAPGCVWNVWRCIFSRDFLERNNLRFIEGWPLAEDLEFMFRAFCCVESVAFFHNPYYQYRVNYGNTLTRRYNAKRVDALIQMITLANAGLKESAPSFLQISLNKLAYEYILNLATCYQVPKADRAEAFRYYKDSWVMLDEADSSAVKLIRGIVSVVGLKPVAAGLCWLKKLKHAYRNVSTRAVRLTERKN